MRTGKKVLSYPIAQPEQAGDIASAAVEKAQRVWRVWLAIVLAARYKHRIIMNKITFAAGNNHRS
jgi:hypothetical protein